MNGHTDESSETVSDEDFRRCSRSRGEKHLARVTFWSVNRDRPCGGGAPEEECSGVQQASLAFSSMLAGYTGQ